MGRKICRREVVFEVVEWSDGGMIVEVCPSDGFIRVEGRVRVDGEENSDERSKDRGNKGKRSRRVNKRRQKGCRSLTS